MTAIDAPASAAEPSDEAGSVDAPEAARPTAPVRVLVVNDHLGYPDGVIHGVTRYYREILPRVDRARASISLAILGARHSFEDEMNRVGIPPIVFGRKKWDPRSLGDIKRLARRLGADVMHLGALKGTILGRLAEHERGPRPLRALIHLHDFTDPGGVMRSIQRAQARSTRLALACSRNVADFGIDTYGLEPSRVRVLHNAMDLDAFRARVRPGDRERVRDELGIPRGVPAMGVVGRLHPSKNQADVIARFHLAVERCPEARLVIVGGGECAPDCERARAASPVKDRITLAGHRDDVPAILAAMDLMAMGSTAGEGFPYSALEALSMGRPMVAFRIGELPLMVEEPGAGVLFPIGAFDDLLREAGAILADDARRAGLGERARASVGRFGIDAHVETLTRCYETLAGRRASIDD